jgi:MarR family transcriptional regulator, organic hydroperoxide resistance regulator
MRGKPSASRRTSKSSVPPPPASARTPRRQAAEAAEDDSSSVLAELAQKFYELLVRHRTAMRDVIVDEGLSPPLMATLHMLGDAAMTMRELAESIGLEPSNLTGIVDRLEARGLVERQSSPDDRRIKRVTLTRAGSAVRRRLIERLQRPTPWMLTLSRTDQKQLLAILRKALQASSPPTTQASAQASSPAGAPPSSKSRR